MVRSLLVIALLGWPLAAAGQDCTALVLANDPRVGLHGDPDLRCFALTPTPAAVGLASGRVELLPVPGPFTVAVTPNGEHVWRLRLRIDSLPEASSLAAGARTYVAWATTPALWPMIRLGPVGRGEYDLGEVGFDKFLVLVSAEASDTVSERRGPLVLRGSSPSTRLQPDHDPFLLSLAMAGLPDTTGAGPAAHGHAQRHGHDVDETRRTDAMPPAQPRAWPHPRMPADVVMLSAMMPRLPRVRPYVPTGGALDVLRAGEGRVDETLTADVVRDSLGMAFGFGGRTPGPTLRVRQGSSLGVRFRNHTQLPMTIHWHGLRVENAFDGVAHHTQQPVLPGESFDYQLTFPDAGIFWYHPHERADVAQDLGLYGNIVVEPTTADEPNVVHAEIPLMIDDMLLTADGARMPHGREAPTHALMGRFGDRLLVNGEMEWRTTVPRGAIVRWLITNAASTRTFNLTFGVDSVKLVGGDIGSYARERWVRSVPIAPAERYVVEVHYDGSGPYAIENRVRGIDHVMGTFLDRIDTMGVVHVDQDAVAAAPARPYGALRTYEQAARELHGFVAAHADRGVDRTLVLRMEADSLPFPLDRLMRLDSAYFHPVEWANTMPDMNWILDAREVHWILEDAATGARGHAIDWSFGAGAVARIRIVNPRGSLHAMQHPIHLHGQRFVVVERDGIVNDDLVWKDTVLVPVGSWVDLLVDFSNPGAWMLHCHIAEHMEAGMHTVVHVH